ncbi:hypothetical protein AMAG_18355 [Allomyces macrogynus ATCC 38327]|uniref:Uncharacterized protein n=1 Tax=Allomyces macrogynus (strain ATCC 38327) TaxID=578462 RepID=A0A0L0S5U7_ALLM3|nr:hypothetical protein AMAG_18355 [Allomyces macrogynus ATCC 38327]|eukprot:KNE57918.1 hypothetical protein AMAG_18355 [Allomyces macrogynus ATCC 38327]
MATQGLCGHGGVHVETRSTRNQCATRRTSWWRYEARCCRAQWSKMVWVGKDKRSAHPHSPTMTHPHPMLTTTTCDSNQVSSRTTHSSSHACARRTRTRTS